MKRILIFFFLAVLSTGAYPPHAAPASWQPGAALPSVDLYALDADNSLWVMRCGQRRFNREISLVGLDSAAIGIDFRPSDGQLYALTKAGTVYRLTLLNGFGVNAAYPQAIGSLTPRFAGGFQSLFDFNPVVDAIRLIGSNDQNFAVLLNIGAVTTIPQTAISYLAGDVSAGVDPNISAGAYTNNLNGAATTVFYALDYDLNTLVTAPIGANGSSATGAGQIQTIGQIPFPLSPTADIDIFTDSGGNNFLIGLSNRQLFTIDLNQIDPALPLGSTQALAVRSVNLPDGGFIDLAATASSRKCGR